jgi:type I restriction-modification system DNA methylase subunit
MSVNIKNINKVKQMEYSNLSKTITKDLSKQEKKDNGIYFTPPTTILKSIEILKPYIKDNMKALEPSCGSCEYINLLHEHNKTIQITGIEYSEKIFQKINATQVENITLINCDFLNYNSTERFDMIFGNPPYFVVKKKENKKTKNSEKKENSIKEYDIPEEYCNYFDGRPNIFILFIIKSLGLLNENGILSFVLPNSFTNCLYYDKLRKYIYENFKIIELLDCSSDKYLETKQDTILFIIQKQKPQKRENDEFVIHIQEYTFMNTKTNILRLRELYKNSTTLHKLDFKVCVGNVVWNQCKDILTNDETKTRLIYSSDIENNSIVKKDYSNNEAKKNYIDKPGIRDTMLVINRGYGVGNYTFSYCLIDVDFNYLIENHLICIKYEKNLKKNELVEFYNKIIKSLENDKTKEFINIYFGNNAINTTELNCILPIYIE